MIDQTQALTADDWIDQSGSDSSIGTGESGSRRLDWIPTGESTLSKYLREACNTPLLSAEEEVELAQRIRKGDESARDHMIRANLRLVVKIAREYESFGLPLLDLISEGNIGLMTAVERFDPSRGCRFSTYGALWIKQSMRRALANQSRTIRLPINLVDRLAKMHRLTSEFERSQGRAPSDIELAESMGISAMRVSRLRKIMVQMTSIDAPVGPASGDSSKSLADLVPDPNAVSPSSAMESRAWTHLLHELVGKLNSRESLILRYRFGLDGGRERTLEQVGARFGVTRERIRQLQNAALNKLRRMIEARDGIQQGA